MNHINNNHAQLFLQQYMQTSLYSIKLGPVGIIPSLSPPRRNDIILSLLIIITFFILVTITSVKILLTKHNLTV